MGGTGSEHLHEAGGIMTMPDWNWYKVNVPNILEIQQELKPLIDKIIPDWQTSESQFVHVDVDSIKSISKLYTELICELGLEKRWHTSAIITTNYGKSLPIHTDVYDPLIRCFAFNIPLINCDDSYTVWYNATSPRINTDDPGDGKDKVLWYDENTAVEIDRMPATTCAFVNNHVPHKPVTKHNNFRAILSSRFDPELFDYNFLNRSFC